MSGSKSQMTRETSQSMRTDRRSSVCRPNKVGLARLAKTRSLSNSTGNLTETVTSPPTVKAAVKVKACVMKSCSCSTLPAHSLTSPCPTNLDSSKTTIFVASDTKTVLSSANDACSIPTLTQTHSSLFEASQVTDTTHYNTTTDMSSKKRSYSFPVFISNTLITLNNDCNVVGNVVEDNTSTTPPQPPSKVSFGLFDEPYKNIPSSLPKDDLCSYWKPSVVSSESCSYGTAGVLLPTKLTVHGLTGSHSQNDLPDYALLKRPHSELEQSRLNRHIGSIRRLLGGRGSISSGSSSADKSSPVIKLTGHGGDVSFFPDPESTDGKDSASSQRRGSSNELSVPPGQPLYRSSSLNMLSEAFTAVHNLCVVPASAGKTTEEVAMTRRSSRSGSPALSSSPGSLFAASAGVVLPHPPFPSPSRRHHTTPKHARRPPKMHSIDAPASECSPTAKTLNKACGLFISLDEPSAVLASNLSNNSYNEFPITTGSCKLNSSATTNLTPTKKKTGIGITLRKLKNSSVSPCQSPRYSPSNCAVVQRTDSPKRTSSVLKTSSKGSAASLFQLPPLAAKPDRCNCVQATPTSSLSRSTAFRDSRRDMAVPHTHSSASTSSHGKTSDAAHNACVSSFSNASNGDSSHASKSSSNHDHKASPSIGVTGDSDSSSVKGLLISCSGDGVSGVSPSSPVNTTSGVSSHPSCQSGGSSSGMSHDSPLSHSSSVFSDDSAVHGSYSVVENTQLVQGHLITEPTPSTSIIKNIPQHKQSIARSKTKSPVHSGRSCNARKKSGRASPLSPPLSLQGSPRHTPSHSLHKQKDYSTSLQQLVEASKGKGHPIRTRPRHNRKDRIRRNKNAQMMHNSVRSKNADDLIQSKTDHPSTCDSSQHSKSVLNTPSSVGSSRRCNGLLNGDRCSSKDSIDTVSTGGSSAKASTTHDRVTVSTSCHELSDRPQRWAGERAMRPQSWGNHQGSSLPGVAAAIGTMVVAGAMSPPLLDSPSNTPSPMSPYASQDSLLADLEDEENGSRDGEPLPTQSATAAILGAISTSELKARSYLYGGLDSLFGPRELDQCLPDRAITIFIATWNMNGKEPPGFLDEFHLGDQLHQEPDMYVIGTQESGAERKAWEVRLQCMIGQKHVLLTSAVLGILHLNIFVRRDLIWSCSLPEESSHSLRPGTYFKTKGAIAIGFQFFGTRFLFINSHLFAHEEKYAQRLQNIKNISHALDLPRALPMKHKHKDITKRFDCVFWLGDMNFRLVANRDHVLDKIQGGVNSPSTVEHLLQWDQLSCAKKKGETFVDYEEGQITFPPTFKFDPGTDNYDSSSKQRVPSYTDRILFKSPRSSISCLEYESSPVFRTSDHKPVWGRFLCKIRPGKDDVPHNAGAFNRDVYVDALKRRRKLQQQHQRRGEVPEGGCGIQ